MFTGVKEGVLAYVYRGIYRSETGGFGVTGVTGMKVNVICEAVEVILRVP